MKTQNVAIKTGLFVEQWLRGIKIPVKHLLTKADSVRSCVWVNQLEFGAGDVFYFMPQIFG